MSTGCHTNLVEENVSLERNIIQMASIKYQIAISKNTSESEILWSRYNALLVFNSLLITVIGFSYQGNNPLPPIIVISLPIAGLISCYLWFMVTFRGFQWIKYWITSARELEKTYLEDKNSYLNPILAGKDNRENILGWPHTQTAANFLIIITSIIYALFLILSFI